MSRSIGGVAFHLFNGRVANLKLRSETWDVFGLDGVGVMLGGYGDGDFQLQTISFFQNSSLSQAHILQCENLQGDIVTIVDAFGRSFADCFIEHVETENCEKAVIWNGFPNAVRVALQWKIRSVA